MLFKQFFIFEWNLKIALKLCTRALDTIASIKIVITLIWTVSTVENQQTISKWWELLDNM